MVEQPKSRIEVNTVNSIITIPHWGVTLRSLFGAALDAWPGEAGETRQFSVHHKDKAIAVINVRKHNQPL